ncbi:MAG: hypothetical protein O3A01_02290 [bacterium]|nr:hypothetical protein [bacterium]
MKYCKKHVIALILVGAIFCCKNAYSYTVLPIRSVGQNDIAELHPHFVLTTLDDAKTTEWLPEFKPQRWPTMAPFTVAIDGKFKQAYMPVPPGFYKYKLMPFPTKGKAVSVAITPTGRLAVITTQPDRIIIAGWNKQGTRIEIIADLPIAKANHVEFLSHSKVVIAYPNKPLVAYRIGEEVLIPNVEITDRLTRYGKTEPIRDLARNDEGNLVVLTDRHIMVSSSQGYLVRRIPINLDLIAITADEENHMWALHRNRRAVHHISMNGQHLMKYDNFVSNTEKINEIAVYKKFMGICTQGRIDVKLIQKPLKDLLKKPIEQTLADKRRSFIELQESYNTGEEAEERSQNHVLDAINGEKEYSLPESQKRNNR